MRISGRKDIVKMTVDNPPIVLFSMSKNDINRSRNRLFKIGVSADMKVIHNHPRMSLLS